MKRVEIVKEFEGKKRKIQWKMREFDRLSQYESYTTPKVQLDDLNFCYNAISTVLGKLYEVTHAQEKARENESRRKWLSMFSHQK